MIRILGRKNSINVQKAMWMVGELGIEYERIDIGLQFGGNDTPEYLAKNPNGLVPTLEDGDVIVWESHSVVRYLAEKYGGEAWWPAGDAAAHARAGMWMDWYTSRLHAPIT
ncbi:MAG: glutathione S-transferase N-terminal domain-containing protein, partial [Rhodospirillaceae bacterium]